VLPYGVTPSFAAYPGSPTLRVATFLAVVRDLLDSLRAQGFRRFLLVNGHGGNTAASSLALEWMGEHSDARVLFHSWWIGPKVWEVVQSIGADASHANWLESFPWTRLPGVDAPTKAKRTVERHAADPAETRRALGDGSFGGAYQRSDEEMQRVWDAGVAEVRELLVSGWGQSRFG
jgi:creatinine amidohydrolase